MSCSRRLVISLEHPSLRGHFPGNPILPGVVVLDEVIRIAEASGQQIIGVEDAKFVTSLIPGMSTNIELFACDKGIEFRVVDSQKTFVSGLLICAEKSSMRSE